MYKRQEVMHKVIKLNAISAAAAPEFGSDYVFGDFSDPEAILLRSFNMHDYAIPESTLCVGRAGAGVNNIPIDACSQRGVVVFNTPGANANAVKELVICGLFLAGRKIADGIAWAKTLEGKGADVGKTVEKGKGAFVGSEIKGKTLGVIGLGAIGAMVANAAIGLGMKVLGYDPYISVDAAWNLNSGIKKETDINEIFKQSNFISLHVPLNDGTRATVNKDTIAIMKDGAAILNFARGELADENAVIGALKSGKLTRYVTDFPTDALLTTENVVAIPHLGASTPEAEDNCAVMVARQVVDFIDNGNITNSVNMPNCALPRQGKSRVTVFHRNVKNMLGSITSIIGGEGVNISNMLSRAKGDFAYLMLDLDEELSTDALAQISGLNDVIRVRAL